MEKKKHGPGDKRTPGTKDYALILGNLIKYRNQLIALQNPQKVLEQFERIAEKLQELGFNSESKKVKAQSRSTTNLAAKIEMVNTIVSEKWHQGKEKHEKQREKDKKK